MHLVYFKPFEEPEISYWDFSGITSDVLNGKIKIEFQGVKSCIGYNDGQEQHRCPLDSIETRQCPYCLSKDISKVYTRMNFEGFEHIRKEITNRPYSVYLAYFGKDIIKCGVCRKERLEMRLKEQGAAYFVHLMDFENSTDAYSMEQMIQVNFGFKNAVRNSTKLKAMGIFNPELLSNSLSIIEKTEPFCGYLRKNPVVTKIDYNLPDIFSVSKNKIDGEILGCRGSFLFYENKQENFAIDLKEKIGEYFKIF
ncbi:MAG: DUF2797 domain-containing protein [Candidatus Micrarchaeia archaeon]